MENWAVVVRLKVNMSSLTKTTHDSYIGHPRKLALNLTDGKLGFRGNFAKIIASVRFAKKTARILRAFGKRAELTCSNAFVLIYVQLYHILVQRTKRV